MFNTKVRLLLIAFMLFSAILAYPAPAWACSCAYPGSPQEELVRAEAVFVGTVTESGYALWNPLYAGVAQVYHQFVPSLPPIMQPGINDRAISFEVEASWRGVKTTHFTVRTGQSGDDCGIRFQQGEQYLVYAHEWHDGSLYAGICSRTAALASATEDLDHLQTEPKLELTYIPPILNSRMLRVAIPWFSIIVLGIVIWRRRRKRKAINELHKE